MLWLCLHSASICNLLERLFTLCQYLQSSGKVLCTLPVSAIFWKGSLHSASICNLLERFFALCQYLQSSERLFTLCQYLQSSGKVLCTLPVSAIFWKGSLHSAIICNLLERLFALCQYLQSSERLFTFCCILYTSQCTCIFLFLEILH